MVVWAFVYLKSPPTIHVSERQKLCFAALVASKWNSLPTDIVVANSVVIFTSTLEAN